MSSVFEWCEYQGERVGVVSQMQCGRGPSRSVAIEWVRRVCEWNCFHYKGRRLEMTSNLGVSSLGHGYGRKVYLWRLAGQESIGFDSGESISNDIVHTTDGRSKLTKLM